MGLQRRTMGIYLVEQLSILFGAMSNNFRRACSRTKFTEKLLSDPVAAFHETNGCADFSDWSLLWDQSETKRPKIKKFATDSKPFWFADESAAAESADRELRIRISESGLLESDSDLRSQKLEFGIQSPGIGKLNSEGRNLKIGKIESGVKL